MGSIGVGAVCVFFASLSLHWKQSITIATFKPLFQGPARGKDKKKGPCPVKELGTLLHSESRRVWLCGTFTFPFPEKREVHLNLLEKKRAILFYWAPQARKAEVKTHGCPFLFRCSSCQSRNDLSLILLDSGSYSIWRLTFRQLD